MVEFMCLNPRQGLYPVVLLLLLLLHWVSQEWCCCVGPELLLSILSVLGDVVPVSPLSTGDVPLDVKRTMV